MELEGENKVVRDQIVFHLVAMATMRWIEEWTGHCLLWRLYIKDKPKV